MRVNGEEITLEKAIQLEDFLLEKGYETNRIAVEYNGSVVVRSSFSEIILKNTDTIEIVCFVGGG